MQLNMRFQNNIPLYAKTIHLSFKLLNVCERYDTIDIILMTLGEHNYTVVQLNYFMTSTAVLLNFL